MDFINQRITPATLITFLKVGLVGVLGGEAWFLGQTVSQPIQGSNLRIPRQIKTKPALSCRFVQLCSAGRIRTCDQSINSRPLYR